MNKKILVQFALFSVLVIIILYTFFFYFYNEENIKEKNVKTTDKIETPIDEKTETLIKDINYSFNDSAENEYQLLAEFGKVNINNPDQIYMTNVVATIYLADSTPVKITSKHANYNKSNHETNFFENVKMTYKHHRSTSKNLDLSFKNNMASMYNDIIYNKPGTKLMADRLEIDLITKNSRIFMNNKSEKIKIIENR